MPECRICTFPVEGARIYHARCKPSIAYLHEKEHRSLNYLQERNDPPKRSRVRLLRVEESGKARWYFHFRFWGRYFVLSRFGLTWS